MSLRAFPPRPVPLAWTLAGILLLPGMLLGAPWNGGTPGTPGSGMGRAAGFGFRSPLVAGEASADVSPSRSVSSDLGDLGTALGHAWTRPFHWEGKDWLRLGGVAGVGLASALLDQEVRSLFERNPDAAGDAVTDLGFWYGKPQTQLAGGLALYVPGAIARSDWLRDTGQMLLANLFVAGIPQQALRVLAGRARPRTGLGNSYFDPFNDGDPYASFVSGHTALAVGSSVVLARQIGHPAATLGLIAMAAATPLSRLDGDVHWFSDVALGALLGWFSGNLVHDFQRKRSGLAARIAIVPDPRGLAVRIGGSPGG